MRVATSRFQNAEVIIESRLAPVRITMSAPRWKLPYELAGTLLDLAPDKQFRNLPEPEFTKRMAAKLFRAGPSRIREQIDAMGAGHAGVVLLCFEQLPGPDFCHRTIVAGWLNVNTAWDVRELEDRSSPPKPRERSTPAARKDAAQGSMFDVPIEASRKVLAKAEQLILDGKVHRGDGVYFVEPAAGVDMYTVTLEPPSCTCRWGQSGSPQACSHRIAATYLNEHGAPHQAEAKGYFA